MSTELPSVVLSPKVVTWISSFLNSSNAKSYSTLNGISKHRISLLSSLGIDHLKVMEVKALATFINRSPQIENLGVSTPKLRRPCQSSSKASFVNYLKAVFGYLNSHPEFWDNLLPIVESTIPNDGSNASKIISKSQPQSLATSVQSVKSNIPTVSDTSENSSPLPSFAAQEIHIERINGTECLNLIKFPSGVLPQNLIVELQRESQYENYPSKLRHEQVKIKQEKVTKSQAPPDPPDDVPISPIELYVSTQLRNMGFSNMQEIMGGIRHIQNSTGTEILTIAPDEQAERVMMFIITQREEKEEARKMDEARRHSEAFILQENQKDDDDDIIMFSYNDMLQTSGPNAMFPCSELLRSKKVAYGFKLLPSKKLKVEQLVRKLLNLEKKSEKWYGKIIPIPYFRHVLTKKIETMVEKIHHFTTDSERSEIVEKLETEINSIESGMYLLSEQVENDLGLKYPKIFETAKEDAKSKGLLDDQERDVIMLD
mmetsp:Transcript_21461/g.31586  ORF Transcript_21461/g.31586 Transcript_21461/m.31586 type:complete len:486 (-) Transcript_21461:60-1517(-)